MAPKSLQELEALAAKEGYGRLFSAFSSVAEGLYACDAVDSLVDASAIDTLLSNFIVPLQSDDISKPDSSGARASPPAVAERKGDCSAAGCAAASCLRAALSLPAAPCSSALVRPQVCTACTAR